MSSIPLIFIHTELKANALLSSSKKKRKKIKSSPLPFLPLFLSPNKKETQGQKNK